LSALRANPAAQVAQTGTACPWVAAVAATQFFVASTVLRSPQTLASFFHHPETQVVHLVAEAATAHLSLSAKVAASHAPLFYQKPALHWPAAHLVASVPSASLQLATRVMQAFLSFWRVWVASHSKHSSAVGFLVLQLATVKV
jgi:hypothetical protein